MKKLLSSLVVVMGMTGSQEAKATDTLFVNDPRPELVHTLIIEEDYPNQLPIRLVELAEELDNPALLSLDVELLDMGHRVEDIIVTGNRYQLLTIRQEGELVQLYKIALDKETLEKQEERRLLGECLSQAEEAGLATFNVVSTENDIYLLSFNEGVAAQPAQGYKFR